MNLSCCGNDPIGGDRWPPRCYSLRLCDHSRVAAFRLTDQLTVRHQSCRAMSWPTRRPVFCRNVSDTCTIDVNDTGTFRRATLLASSVGRKFLYLLHSTDHLSRREHHFRNRNDGQRTFLSHDRQILLPLRQVVLSLPVCIKHSIHTIQDVDTRIPAPQPPSPKTSSPPRSPSTSLSAQTAPGTAPSNKKTPKATRPKSSVCHLASHRTECAH